MPEAVLRTQEEVHARPPSDDAPPLQVVHRCIQISAMSSDAAAVAVAASTSQMRLCDIHDADSLLQPKVCAPVLMAVGRYISAASPPPLHADQSVSHAPLPPICPMGIVFHPSLQLGVRLDNETARSDAALYVKQYLTTLMKGLEQYFATAEDLPQLQLLYLDARHCELTDDTGPWLATAIIMRAVRRARPYTFASVGRRQSALQNGEPSFRRFYSADVKADLLWITLQHVLLTHNHMSLRGVMSVLENLLTEDATHGVWLQQQGQDPAALKARAVAEAVTQEQLYPHCDTQLLPRLFLVDVRFNDYKDEEAKEALEQVTQHPPEASDETAPHQHTTLRDTNAPGATAIQVAVAREQQAAAETPISLSIQRSDKVIRSATSTATTSPQARQKQPPAPIALCQTPSSSVVLSTPPPTQPATASRPAAEPQPQRQSQTDTPPGRSRIASALLPQHCTTPTVTAAHHNGRSASSSHRTASMERATPFSRKATSVEVIAVPRTLRRDPGSGRTSVVKSPVVRGFSQSSSSHRSSSDPLRDTELRDPRHTTAGRVLRTSSPRISPSRPLYVKPEWQDLIPVADESVEGEEKAAEKEDNQSTPADAVSPVFQPRQYDYGTLAPTTGSTRRCSPRASSSRHPSTRSSTPIALTPRRRAGSSHRSHSASSTAKRYEQPTPRSQIPTALQQPLRQTIHHEAPSEMSSAWGLERHCAEANATRSREYGGVQSERNSVRSPIASSARQHRSPPRGGSRRASRASVGIYEGGQRTRRPSLAIPAMAPRETTSSRQRQANGAARRRSSTAYEKQEQYHRLNGKPRTSTRNVYVPAAMEGRVGSRYDKPYHRDSVSSVPRVSSGAPRTSRGAAISLSSDGPHSRGRSPSPRPMEANGTATQGTTSNDRGFAVSLSPWGTDERPPSATPLDMRRSSQALHLAHGHRETNQNGVVLVHSKLRTRYYLR